MHILVLALYTLINDEMQYTMHISRWHVDWIHSVLLLKEPDFTTFPHMHHLHSYLSAVLGGAPAAVVGGALAAVLGRAPAADGKVSVEGMG